MANIHIIAPEQPKIDILQKGETTQWGSIIGSLDNQTDLQSELDSLNTSITTTSKSVDNKPFLANLYMDDRFLYVDVLPNTISGNIAFIFARYVRTKDRYNDTYRTRKGWIMPKDIGHNDMPYVSFSFSRMGIVSSRFHQVERFKLIMQNPTFNIRTDDIADGMYNLQESSKIKDPSGRFEYTRCLRTIDKKLGVAIVKSGRLITDFMPFTVRHDSKGNTHKNFLSRWADIYTY